MPRPRILWADLIRLVAIVEVVALHVASASQAESFNRPDYWWTLNLFNSICRPCVPLFIMVSGLVLLDPATRESPRRFYEKRAVRVLVPYVLWTAIYVTASALWSGARPTVWSIVVATLGTPWGHLWFLQMMLGIYLVTPVMRAMVRGSTREELALLGLLCVAWVVLSATPRVPWWAIPSAPKDFLGYFVAGYLLRDVALRGGRLALIAAAQVAALAVTAIGTYRVTALQPGRLVETFYGNMSPNVVLLSVTAFLLIKQIPVHCWLTSHPRWQAALRSVGNDVFGIYLVHELFLSPLQRISLNAVTVHPLVAVPMVTAITLTLSWLLVRVLRQIPYVRVALLG
jgi:surface polysaccharide O-acyltransferase-like enzyme